MVYLAYAKATMRIKRLRSVLIGQVQGVGLRPSIYRIAHHLGLTGWVKNTASGVVIEVQGCKVHQFIPQLLLNLPPLTMLDSIHTKNIAVQKAETLFQIIESQAGQVKTLIPPDTAICTACLQELFDPESRYYLYPFLNCTHCGPRLSITHQLPYDRQHTSMHDFQICQECQQDYSDPSNRRYHAQPIACPKCGPQISCTIAEIATLILDGKIVAIKGLCGYQLICDAKNKNAVLALRARKNRESKPFALMVVNSISANSIVELSEDAENALLSKERPIVLLPKKNNMLDTEIAPTLAHYGVMLPYTPLYYLLFHALKGFPQGNKWLEEYNETILVVTSANAGGYPLIYDDAVAHAELNQIADHIVHYNRKIVCPADDSVMQIIDAKPVYIRRARGAAPTRIKLPHAIPPTLAVGSHLKNTFCLTRDDEAFISPHVGNLNNKPTIDLWHDLLRHFMQLLNIHPERIAHDIHPDFYTTRFAQEYGLPTFAVQHHHAHLAAVAAEHHIKTPALGLALDGYGYGSNGEAWGGELLLLDNIHFQKLSGLYPLVQPGGDIATREPWRMAAGILHMLGRDEEIPLRFSAYAASAILPAMLEKKMNTPFTSSGGRLFDAASAILRINEISHYEGHAAMQLESLVTQPEILPEGWRIEGEYFNMLPTLTYLFDIDPLRGANVFHGTLIAGLAEWVGLTAKKMDLDVVLLSGGCFLNKILTEGLIRCLSQQGLKTFFSQKIPPNDGGISLGQGWIAGRR